jgi:hypothetical protein
MNTNERELILNECKSREFISVYSRAFAVDYRRGNYMTITSNLGYLLSSDIHKIDRFFSSENVHGLNSEQWLMGDRKMESQM